MKTFPKLALAALALISGLTLQPAPAEAAAPTAVCYSGVIDGSLTLPASSGVGKLNGRFQVSGGPALNCSALIWPDPASPLTSEAFWTAGTVEGQLTPLQGGGSPGRISVVGSYLSDFEGNGTLALVMYLQPVLFGMPPIWIGTVSGQFVEAATLDPQTLLAVPGDFHATWNGCL